MATTIHCLYEGQPLCGFSSAVPAEWPDDHLWTALAEWPVDDEAAQAMIDMACTLLPMRVEPSNGPVVFCAECEEHVREKR